MPHKKVAIIGAGVGGLCCGIRLAHAGYHVSIYEKEATPGGVAKHCHDASTGTTFDSFATIGIHPEQYNEVFHDVGLDPENYFKSIQLDTLYKVFYGDGTSFSLAKQYWEDKDRFESFFEESLSDYMDIVNHLTQKYEIANRTLLSKPLYRAKQFINPRFLKSAFSLHPMPSAQNLIKQHITSKKLTDLLLFQTFYMGLDPQKISNVYASIPAVTQTEGLLYVMGGMGAYISGLVKAFSDLGGHLVCNRTVRKILFEGSKAVGLQCDNEIILADIVVSNADYNFTMHYLLPKEHQPKRIIKPTMSCSVFVLRLALNTSLPMLSLHNIFLPDGTQKELESVSKGLPPLNPPLYIYYPSHVDPNFQKACPACVNVMMRVPNLCKQKDFWANDTVHNLEELCIRKLIQITGMENLRGKILAKATSTPFDLKHNFNCWQGAAFGLAPSYLQSMMFRPQIKQKKVDQLYLVGSSIHPGNGISIVMKGAKLTAQQIMLDTARPKDRCE